MKHLICFASIKLLIELEMKVCGVTITEKAPTRAFSLLNVSTSAFTLYTENTFSHFAKWALTHGRGEGAFSVIVKTS